MIFSCSNTNFTLAIKGYSLDHFVTTCLSILRKTIDNFFLWTILQGERKEVLLGPMKLYQSPMQVRFESSFFFDVKRTKLSLTSWLETVSDYGKHFPLNNILFSRLTNWRMFGPFSLLIGPNRLHLWPRMKPYILFLIFGVDVHFIWNEACVVDSKHFFRLLMQAFRISLIKLKFKPFLCLLQLYSVHPCTGRNLRFLWSARFFPRQTIAKRLIYFLFTKDVVVWKFCSLSFLKSLVFKGLRGVIAELSKLYVDFRSILKFISKLRREDQVPHAHNTQNSSKGNLGRSRCFSLTLLFKKSAVSFESFTWRTKVALNAHGWRVLNRSFCCGCLPFFSHYMGFVVWRRTWKKYDLPIQKNAVAFCKQTRRRIYFTCEFRSRLLIPTFWAWPWGKILDGLRTQNSHTRGHREKVGGIQGRRIHEQQDSLFIILSFLKPTPEREIYVHSHPLSFVV